MYIFIFIYNNKVIINWLENYLIPPRPPPPLKNGCLLHIDPKLYIKCPLQRFDMLPSLG
jgi:hypothetical protein